MVDLPPPPAPVAVVQSAASRDVVADRFDEHQARVGTTLARIDDLLGKGRSETFALALARWQLLREARTYQLFKHIHIFDPAQAGDTPRQAKAAILKARCVALGERVVRHVTDWSGRDTQAQWDVFAPEARALVRAIELHLRTERAECARLRAS